MSLVVLGLSVNVQLEQSHGVVANSSQVLQDLVPNPVARDEAAIHTQSAQVVRMRAHTSLSLTNLPRQSPEQPGA